MFTKKNSTDKLLCQLSWQIITLLSIILKKCCLSQWHQILALLALVLTNFNLPHPVSAVIMIAECTGKNIWVTNTIVHPTSPPIDISSHEAILSGMAWGMAAVKVPTSVFITIAMIAKHSVKDIVGSTLRIERLTKPIHITSPIAMIPWWLCNSMTFP